jgi:hypothetical protein
MRTTLAIDDDVLAAAKSLAALERRSVGEVISSLARQALRREPGRARARNGVPLLRVKSPRQAVTLELVNQLRDEAP